ncbi:hypothetical protein H1230_07545 [Paenibacillus sp. 19GGS1-52]|uniref:hypothetical protein n=1 Tax=Paenibacillus sp. 19GGS1-52 TaxID=2758563 RepID=UPI001EFBF719|nr:hypothetical protein [Paenibacillus sp. 19GGS1-52]ULO08641.1 hypothetical protein H1230_07545 [Paenibacillus sp. 19GGS1-52]
MKTYIFVRNLKYRPSTYYRIYQYIQDYSNENILISEFEKNEYYEKKNNKSLRFFNKVYYGFLAGYIRRILFLLKMYRNKGYIIYIQREVFPKFIGPLGMFLLKKALQKSYQIYWDFDDNIFATKEITHYEKKKLSDSSRRIIVGNQFLKEKIDKKYFHKIDVINTSDIMMKNIDIERVNIARLKEFDDQVVLLWVGTKINLIYLENIIEELDKAATQLNEKKLILRIVSNANIIMKTKKLKIENIVWDRDRALDEMLKAHIGLMPLSDDEITKGKCAFKAVQNIGCGLPIIISNVGMNKELIYDNGYLINENNEWIFSVIELCNDKQSWLNKSRASRRLWEKKFNAEKIKKYLFELLQINNI